MHGVQITGAPVNDVVTIAAGNNVQAAVSGQDVITGRSDDVFEILDLVTRTIAAKRTADDGLNVAFTQLHRNGKRRSLVAQGITAADSAVENIRAGSTFDEIATVSAEDCVGLAIAGQSVIPRRADDVLKVRNRIAVGVAARYRRRGEVYCDRNTGGAIGVGITDGVAQRSISLPVENVSAGTTLDRIVAVAAQYLVRQKITGQDVVALAASEMLEVGDSIFPRASGNLRAHGCEDSR